MSGPMPLLRASLAGPPPARYTTLVAKHSESSDATNSCKRVRCVTPGPRLVLRARRPQGTQVALAPGLALGGRAFVVMAGPCAVEDAAQIGGAAAGVAAAGCAAPRGGGAHPRTSPYA